MSILDDVLRKSLASASPHTKKVFGQNPLTGQEIIDMANERGPMTLLSTVKPNSRPHMSPADVSGVDGTFYLGVAEDTAHYSNLKKNPAVAMIIVDGWKRQALVEGTVKFLDMKSSIVSKVLEAQKKKTGWTTQTVAEIIPEKLFSRKSKQT